MTSCSYIFTDGITFEIVPAFINDNDSLHILILVMAVTGKQLTKARNKSYL